MGKLTEFDKNFLVKSEIGEETVFFDIEEAPFKIYGLMRDENGYCRMPQEIADNVNPGVKYLNRHTAGGRVRFATDSRRITVRAQMVSFEKGSHFALTGSAGLDLYADGIYNGTFCPPMDIVDSFTSTLGFDGRDTILPDSEEKRIREITIHLPLYTGVTKLEIGLENGSVLAGSKPYAIEKPVIYYGSSITQGGCASRPGNCYQNIISRKMDVDHINLGFSGSARGEEIMADYLASLDMSVFVYDYDYNAPTIEHLQNTHEKMFKRIREKNPTLPIIMMSHPCTILNDSGVIRRNIILQTYLNAYNSGDRNVYFIDGSTMFDSFGGDSATVDNVHPNDLGFMCMAYAVMGRLENLLPFLPKKL